MCGGGDVWWGQAGPFKFRHCHSGNMMDLISWTRRIGILTIAWFSFSDTES